MPPQSAVLEQAFHPPSLGPAEPHGLPGLHWFMDHLPGSPLPAVLAPLYGREHDLARLLTLLRGGTRLLTLRGPGGIGKTTLALHLAQALRTPGETGFDHVQLIDLSAVRAPDGVLGLIAASLPDSGPKGDPQRRIQGFASTRCTLLILDNFEQVLSAASEVGEILSASPTLQVLVTSRAALRLHDEVEYPVEPLELAHRARDAASSAAVQLFVARVQSVQPTFALTVTTTPQVARLCEALEGVPLALELAAVRMRSLSLGDLLARLEHPLQVLKADFRDRPERLRSLRAAVQWSYDLLSEEERAVFECCAVFDGPFTPEALSGVWGSPDVLDQAEALLEQSLLQRVNAPETLWKMLQPLKELALEHLEDHPLVGVWRERHSLHYLNLIEENTRRWQLEIARSWNAYLPHLPNIRAGLVWAVEEHHSDLAYRYLGSIRGLWNDFGLHGQEFPLVERVLALPEPEDRVTLLRALDVSQSSVNSRGSLQAREARAQRVLALARELDDVQVMGWASLALAQLARDTGQGERSWEYAQQVIRGLPDRVGDAPPPLQHRILRGAGYLHASLSLLELGRHAEALEYALRAREDRRLTSTRNLELEAMTTAGYLLLFMNRVPEGTSLLLLCLHDGVDKGMRGIVEYALLPGLTLLAAERQEWTTLVQFVAFVNDLSWERLQSVPERRLRQDMDLAREALGEVAYQQAWTTGHQLQLEDVVDLADQLAHPPVSPVLYPELTPREREVLALVSQGHPDRKVARLLGMTPGTASKHVGNLLGKLGLRNRVELTRWAIDHAPPQAGN